MATRLILGVTVAAWFPAAAAVFRFCRMWTAWFRLRPLWALLLEAAPDVLLPVQPGTCLSASYRLHRRVIEIRDAELALRPYQDSRAVGIAIDAACSAGLPPDEHDVVIEAVMIVTALDACHAGAEPRTGPAPDRVVSEPRNDLKSETARLLQVSQAVRHSPIVRQAVRSARDHSHDPSACMSRIQPEASRAGRGVVFHQTPPNCPRL